MSEETKTVEELQAELAKLKEEIAALKAQQAEAAEEAPVDDSTTSIDQTIDASTEDKDIKVETYCRWAAARAGAIVIAPLLGTVALMANEVYLVSRIARVYDVKLTERALIAFLGAMGSRVAGNLLTTLIPFSAIQVPVAVGITYSLGKVTQRWMKDGMPSDMTPYIQMMGEWKDKAREQVDKLRESPLKNVPLGDETIDFMKKWGNTAKDAFIDFKEKGQKLYNNVIHKEETIVEEVAEEKAKEDAATGETVTEEQTTVITEETTTPDTPAGPAAAAAPEKAEFPAEQPAPSEEEQAKAAVEDAKIPLEDK